MTRLLATLVAIVAAWFGIPQPAVGAVLPAPHISITAYDGHAIALHFGNTASDRGPTWSNDRATLHDADDPLTYGASARTDDSTTTAAYGYEGHAMLAQVASGSRGTEGQAAGTRQSPVVIGSLHVAAKAGDDVLRALSATERRTLDDALRPDKLDHIFDPKHNFQPLVQQFGSREAAMEQIVRSIGGPLPQAGRFEIAQSIGGQTVIIRGAVVDGIPRIGTAFTP